MCNFFSCVSNGEGEVKWFDVKDIVEQMAIGNPKDYSWNSHTSICQFHGINSRSEDLWNKWEYDPEKKTITPDSRPQGVKDDSPAVKEKLEKFFEGKDILFLRNLYGKNSGSRNSGNWNSGNWNSGDWNSGHGDSGSRNSGDGNSGDWNSGNGNSGDWNSGDWNSGNWNSGNGNSGDGNSGDWNSGDRNSGSGNSGNGNSGNGNSGNRNIGDGNSGNRNSGDWNSGNGNSGNWNSGNGMLNSFCTKRQYRLFDKVCSESEYKKLKDLPWEWFEIEIWVSGGDMTEAEKKEHPYWNITGGYLKHIPYKEAWKKCPKEFIEKVKKLKGFTKDKFKEISGLDV